MAKSNGVNVPGMGQGEAWQDKNVGSVTPYRCDLLPPLALLAVARLRHEAVQKHGEDGIDDWLQSDPRKHLNKVEAHILTARAGDTSEGEPEEHLVHALCRLMFAVELNERRRLAQAPVVDVQFGVSGMEETVARLGGMEAMLASIQPEPAACTTDLPPWACVCVRRLVAERCYGYYCHDTGEEPWNRFTWRAGQYVSDKGCRTCGGTGHKDDNTPYLPKQACDEAWMLTNNGVADIVERMAIDLSMHYSKSGKQLSQDDVARYVAAQVGMFATSTMTSQEFLATFVHSVTTSILDSFRLSFAGKGHPDAPNYVDVKPVVEHALGLRGKGR